MSMMESLMHDLIKELDWYYSNRKGMLLPIWYEPELMIAVKAASEMGACWYEEVTMRLRRLKNAHPDQNCGIISNR